MEGIAVRGASSRYHSLGISMSMACIAVTAAGTGVDGANLGVAANIVVAESVRLSVLIAVTALAGMERVTLFGTGRLHHGVGVAVGMIHVAVTTAGTGIDCTHIGVICMVIMTQGFRSVALIAVAAGAGMQNITTGGTGSCNSCAGVGMGMLGIAVTAAGAGVDDSARRVAFLVDMTQGFCDVALITMATGAGVDGVALLCTGRCNYRCGIAMNVIRIAVTTTGAGVGFTTLDIVMSQSRNQTVLIAVATGALVEGIADFGAGGVDNGIHIVVGRNVFIVPDGEGLAGTEAIKVIDMNCQILVVAQEVLCPPDISSPRWAKHQKDTLETTGYRRLKQLLHSRYSQHGTKVCLYLVLSIEQARRFCLHIQVKLYVKKKQSQIVVPLFSPGIFGL